MWDRADLVADGIVGYLCFRQSDGRRELQAALFVVNGRAEPLDFVFSRATLPGGFLWRTADARRLATASLVKTLFAACPGRPQVLFASAQEVAADVFAEDIEVDVPLARLSDDVAHGPGPTETVERLGDGLHAFWSVAPVEPNSPARLLLDRLVRSGLLMEPFERALAGLEEADGR